MSDNHETIFVFGTGFIWGVIVSACVYGISLVIPLLLENPNDSPRHRYPDNSTCLYQALNLKEAASLIRRGADVNARDDRGQTPLHEYLCDRHTINDVFDMRQFQMVNLLLLNGADPNIQDKDGQTSLHFYLKGVKDRHTGRTDPNPAVSHAILSCLLNAGADLRIKDKWGNTPVDYVTNEETREYLLHWENVYSDREFARMMYTKPQKMEFFHNPRVYERFAQDKESLCVELLDSGDRCQITLASETFDSVEAAIAHIELLLKQGAGSRVLVRDSGGKSSDWAMQFKESLQKLLQKFLYINCEWYVPINDIGEDPE